jgi:GxxExxY protein
MKKEIKKLIDKVKNCAKEVYKELREGWPECVYHEAMEIALREAGINYETKRVLPISFKGYIVGRSEPDLIVWLNRPKGKRLAIVVDLK